MQDEPLPHRPVGTFDNVLTHQTSLRDDGLLTIYVFYPPNVPNGTGLSEGNLLQKMWVHRRPLASECEVGEVRAAGAP